MKLEEYIADNFTSKAEFARLLNPPVVPQQITKWINAGRIVWKGKMYSPKQELPELESKNKIS